MTDSKLDRLRGELQEWRARLDHLRVQANLGKMELRDELQRIGERLEPAQREARERLSQLIQEGSAETANVAKSLEAGWSELWRKHSELAREQEERRRSEGGSRSS